MEFHRILFISFNVLSSIKISASHYGMLYLTWSQMSLCLLLERIGSCFPLRTACFQWRLHQKMDSPMLMYDFLPHFCFVGLILPLLIVSCRSGFTELTLLHIKWLLFLLNSGIISAIGTVFGCGQFTQTFHCRVTWKEGFTSF